MDFLGRLNAVLSLDDARHGDFLEESGDFAGRIGALILTVCLVLVLRSGVINLGFVPQILILRLFPRLALQNFAPKVPLARLWLPPGGRCGVLRAAAASSIRHIALG